MSIDILLPVVVLLVAIMILYIIFRPREVPTIDPRDVASPRNGRNR